MNKSQKPLLSILGATGLAILLGASAAPGQFGLPKLPKLPKKVEKKASPEKSAPAAAPELIQITPDSVQPGGAGDLVLVGKNFPARFAFNITCSDTNIEVETVKVETPERAVARIRVPLDVKEGTCDYLAASYGMGPQGEIQASAGPSTEVVQVKGATLKISNSGALPVILRVQFMGEGDMDFMTMTMKMAEQAQKMSQGNWQEAGASSKQKPVSGLFVEGGSLKFVQDDGKTAFAESASGVKAIQELQMAGQATGGIFRIVFNNGKIYNFSGDEGAVQYLKKRFAK